MQFNALRYFHETARTGSIRKAAETLHVAPSAISRQISNLEHDFNAPLFERTNQGMRLTAAGVLLARQTQRTFRDLDRVKSAVDDLRGLRRGSITAYVIEGMVADFLPRVLAEFQDKYPGIDFNIYTGSTDRIIQALVDDEADIGITFNAAPRADIVSVMDYREPLKCLVANDHPLAEAKVLTLRDIHPYPLALPDQSFGLRQMIDVAFRERRLSSAVWLNTNSLELTKTMAITGRAISFMPAVSVLSEVARDRLRSIPLMASEWTESCTSICVHRDRDLPFAAREFLKTVTRKLDELAGGSTTSEQRP